MTNLSQPEITNLLGEIRDMQRRIADLERGNGLTGALPQGESLVVLDPDTGLKLGIIGRLPNGTDGAQFNSTGNATTFRVGPDGIERPRQHVPVFALPYARVNVTAAAFTTAYRAMAISYQHRWFRASMLVGADAGTNGELKVVSLFTGEESSVLTITGTGSSAGRRYDMYLANTPGGSSDVEVQIRRTAGAGNVWAERVIISYGEVSSDPSVWI